MYHHLAVSLDVKGKSEGILYNGAAAVDEHAVPRVAAAAASAHENGGSGAEGSDAAVRSPDPDDSTSGGLLQPAPVVQRLRNPFADDADDEDQGVRDKTDLWNRSWRWKGCQVG